MLKSGIIKFDKYTAEGAVKMRYKKYYFYSLTIKAGISAHSGLLQEPGYLAETLKANAVEYDVLDMAVGYSTDDLNDKSCRLSLSWLLSASCHSCIRSYEIIKLVKQINLACISQQAGLIFPQQGKGA